MNDGVEVLDQADHLPVMTDVIDASLAVGLTRAELDQQIVTARRFPRKLTTVAQVVFSLATLDEETAEECMYALPRGGKPIKGPSIRFAEIVKSAYGNCRVAARVVHVDRHEKVVIAEGVFHDLENNTATRAEVRRRICDKHGRIYSDDMVIVTGNAACSIALRNAILGGIPKPIWRKGYDAVQKTIAGDIATLSETREKAVRALATFGVTPEQAFQALGVAGPEDIKIDHIPIMRGMFAALKNGEATVEEMFTGTVPSRGGHSKVANPLADQNDKVDAETGEVSTSQHAGETRQANTGGADENVNASHSGTDAATKESAALDKVKKSGAPAPPEGGDNPQAQSNTDAGTDAPNEERGSPDKNAKTSDGGKQPSTNSEQADDVIETEGDLVDASARGEAEPATHAGSASTSQESAPPSSRGSPVPADDKGRAGAAPDAGASSQQPADKPSIFREYADKMNATKSVDGLKGAHRKFRDTRVWPDEKPKQDVLQKIHETCEARLKDEIPAKAARDTLIDLIDQGERLQS